jgi:hypothetical protein
VTNDNAGGDKHRGQRKDNDRMKDEIQLTPSWILTTDHPSSRYGIPVLVNQATREGYGPEDLYEFPSEVGGKQSCARFVAKFGRRLTGNELEVARLFLSQSRGGPQL